MQKSPFTPRLVPLFAFAVGLLALPAAQTRAATEEEAPAPSPAEALRQAYPVRPGALSSPALDIKIVRTSKPIAGGRALAEAWVLVVENRSSEVFDQVVLSFNRFSNPNSEISARGLFPPGRQEFWEVPECFDIDLFAVGLIDNGQLVVSTGDIRQDTTDGDYCFDGIAFTD